MNEIIKEQIRMMNYAIDGIVSVYGNLAKKCGLSYNGLMVFYVIEEYGKCTQKKISEILQLSKSTVHSILLDFVKNGYVVLNTEESNKKEKLIKLTQKGEIYVKEVMDKVHKVEIEAMKKLGEDICLQLVKSNTAFYEALKNEVENE